jgi:hypothetical protein
MATAISSPIFVRDESPVKHTSAGEMPDTSRFAPLRERIEADIPVLTMILRERRFYLPMLIAGVCLSAFFFSRKIRNQSY